MVDNRKRAAAVRGAKKLLEIGTPQEEIISTLIELGIKEADTAGIIDEAANLASKADALEPAQEKAKEEIVQQHHGPAQGEIALPSQSPAPKQEIKVPRFSNAAAGHGFAEKRRAIPRTKNAPFWKKILPIGKNYIPKLRTGGRNRVKEIIVDSPLDAP